MLEVSKALRDSYQSASAKNLVLEFDDGTTIDNDDIALEDMELEQAISDEDALRFGGISSASFKTKVKGTLKKYKGLWFNAFIRFEDYEIQLGRFCVDSDVATSDRRYRDIVAYDELYTVMNKDVSEWYNGLTFPITIKNMRNSLFAHLGIEQIETFLPNDNISIEKTIDGTEITGQKILSAICELNACFGVINNEGKFKYVFIENVVENTLYPSEDLYPQDGYKSYFNKSNYNINTLKYEEYDVNEITKVTIREDSEDVGVSVGTDGNTYIIEDNFLVYGATKEVLTTIAKNFLANVDFITYTPCSFTCSACPWLEVGDVVKITATDKVFSIPILSRVLKGIQAPKDTISARGSENYEDASKGGLSGEIRQLKSRTNRLTRTIDETRSEITRVEEDVNGELVKMQSSITQNAEEIELKVSKGNVSSQLSLESDQITINGNRLVINASNITIDKNGNVEISGKLKAGTGSNIGSWGVLDNGVLGSAYGSAGNYYGIAFDSRQSMFNGALSGGTGGRVFAIGRLGDGNTSSVNNALTTDTWANAALQIFANGKISTSRIEAVGGTIGGWKIENGYLQGDADSGSYVRLYPKYIQWQSAGSTLSKAINWTTLLDKINSL